MTSTDGPRAHPGTLVWAILLLLAVACTGGCSEQLTSVNRPLNSNRVAYELRARNHTRAATRVGVASPDASGSTRVRAPAPGDPATSPARADDADTNPDGFFVGLALSGGGSRSANFSAACMFQLERLGLLSRVDYISSVSGGSLTAAYYCLARDQYWNPANVQRRLTHPFATDLILQTLLPWNTLTLWFTDWDRSDVLADCFTPVLYSRRGRPLTFGDLRRDRPRLLINATDLQSGRRFIFSDEAFDELNSDLSKYPIASAVTASAAVPVLMHHVTLRDFSTNFRQFRHLIDGGITDNLGVQTLAETYTAQIESAARAGRPDPYPHGAVLIVLDARTQFDARLSDKGDIGFVEGLATGAGLTSTALLNRASTATLSELVVRNAADDISARELRAQIDGLEKGGSLTLRGRNGKPVRVIHLALSHLDDLSTLPFHSFRERVSTIGTYFNISATEAFNLYQAAELLVHERFETELAELETDIREGRTPEPPAPAAGDATRPPSSPPATRRPRSWPSGQRSRTSSKASAKCPRPRAGRGI
jgi:predicted acylesterase/phospholipase RssA